LGKGRLSGIPFGVKDIYETRELATEYGSPLCAGRKGSTDATHVTQLRKLGAVLLGKTHTTAFAYFDLKGQNGFFRRAVSCVYGVLSDHAKHDSGKSELPRACSSTERV
jgi:Asp-tRNA(Asn)/Glu-tRNA(Gln) amidotransferase A subunit family amidase